MQDLYSGRTLGRYHLPWTPGGNAVQGLRAQAMAAQEVGNPRQFISSLGLDFLICEMGMWHP